MNVLQFMGRESLKQSKIRRGKNTVVDAKTEYYVQLYTTETEDMPTQTF